MKFFLDTANVEQIKRINNLGLCDGVTTNPSIINKEGRDFKEVVKEICSIVDGPVSAEVTSYDYEGMVKGSKYLIKRGNKNQLHLNLFSKPGTNGSKGWSNLYFTIYRKNR